MIVEVLDDLEQEHRIELASASQQIVDRERSLEASPTRDLGRCSRHGFRREVGAGHFEAAIEQMWQQVARAAAVVEGGCARCKTRRDLSDHRGTALMTEIELGKLRVISPEAT